MSDPNLPSVLSAEDALRWKLHDAQCEVAQLRLEKAQREATTTHNERAQFQQGVLNRYRIDTTRDRIDGDGAIVRAPRLEAVT